MAYPQTPLPVEVDVEIDGAWTSMVTTGQGVLERDPVGVAAGRSSWAGRVDPGRGSWTARTADGRWLPDWQASPLHRKWRRNLRARIGVGLGASYLHRRGAGANVASTPDPGNPAVDLDVRVDMTLTEDLPHLESVGGLARRIAHKSNGSTGGWEWSIYRAAGEVRSAILWRPATGPAIQVSTDQSGAELPLSWMWRRGALRFTLDGNTGGRAATWWTAPTIAGPWTQLGQPVTNPASTSIGSTTNPLRVGGNPADAFVAPLGAQIHAFELRNGIDGPALANPRFDLQAPGVTSFVDSAGKTWTVGTDGQVANTRWRWHGELASLPARWDLSGVDVTTPIEGAGILRRLRQGPTVLDSAVYRAITRQADDLVAYWPMEDASDTGITRFGAAVGGAPLVVTVGRPTPATSTLFPSSKPLPTVGGAVMASWLTSYPQAPSWQLRWFMAVPAGLTGADVHVLRVDTEDLTFDVRWQENDGGNLRVVILRGNVQIYTSGWIVMNSTGRALRLHLGITTSVSGQVSWNLESRTVGTGFVGGLSASDVVTGTARQARGLVVNPSGLMGDTAIGHITLQSILTDANELADGLDGYFGERAGDRIDRLCQEEGIPLRFRGDPATTEKMSYQRPAPLVELLQDCADVDGGILAEARDSFALWYRARTDMLAQAGTTLDYSAGHVAGTPELDRDDATLVNDVTVSSPGGTGRAALDDASPLSVSQPPVGAGRYATDVTLPCLSSRAADIAGWRLELGTVDEPRVSRLELDTNLPAVVASPALTAAVLDLGLGDVVDVGGLPALIGSTRQIVQGIRERIGLYSHRVELATTPASPWDVALVGVDARYDTAGSTAAAAASGATTLVVTTTLGPAWITTASHPTHLPVDIDVDGVLVTVTAIVSATSPQTFTITPLPRAVPAGAAVRLRHPSRYEL